jgi:hypothetical protein
MLGRLDVPADAAAGLQRKPSDGEQPSSGDRAAAAGREVYILAAADAVEGALNSHRVWKPHFLPPMRHSGAHLAHAWAPQRINGDFICIHPILLSPDSPGAGHVVEHTVGCFPLYPFGRSKEG